MKPMKQGMAVLLIVLLMMSAMPVKATETVEMRQSVMESGNETVSGAESEDNKWQSLEGSIDILMGESSEKHNEYVGEFVDSIETTDNGNSEIEELDADNGIIVDSNADFTDGDCEITTEENAGQILSDDVAEPEKAEVTTESKEGTDVDSLPEKIVEFGKPALLFNTGIGVYLVVNPSMSEREEYEGYTGVFGEDGSYTIQIPETDPLFPYEVQFTDLESGEMQNLWFMNPDSVVEFGGHAFRVEANFTGNVVTQFSLNIAGDVVVAYPEEKDFSGASTASLLPLRTAYLKQIDLSDYTPIERTLVSIESIYTGYRYNATGYPDLKDTDSIMWTIHYRGDNSTPDYTVSLKGDCVNLLWAHDFEMIVGEDDQLAADNNRYVGGGFSNVIDKGWLTPVLYKQSDSGVRDEVKTEDYIWKNDKNKSTMIIELDYARTNNNISEGYFALQMNNDSYTKTKVAAVRAYEGWHNTAEEAMIDVEVTDQIFSSDMKQTNAGYKVRKNVNNKITLVSFDAQGNVTGCLPLTITWTDPHLSGIVRGLADMSLPTGYVSQPVYRYTGEDGCEYYTQYVYDGFAKNGEYLQTFDYLFPRDVTAVYMGIYDTMTEAADAGATDVTDSFVRYSGILADFSDGVSFTVFIERDGAKEQEVLKYNIRTEEYDSVSTLNSDTSIDIRNVIGVDGISVPSTILQDDYAENNYVAFVVDDDVDRSNLALQFFPGDSSTKLYATGSSVPEVSEKSYHDFSQGPVQFTATAENGINSKNYWVQVISRAETNGQLFMTSLADGSIPTTNKDGVIYTTREVMLDALHDNKHDIILANMNTDAIKNLYAELDSNVVELDNYWTLKGNHELSGFTTGYVNNSYGMLPNLAMLRLRAKEGVANGTDVTGTLTIKSGTTTLMVITLTGMVGSPSIITEEIPGAVKYVPYGTMIQNSNKYSWNTVSYMLLNGTLPAGMSIMSNGELYGVPREEGEFTFTVRMNNSYSSFGSSDKTYTLIVNENTDENVDGQTDASYELTERVTYRYNSSLGDQLMVSQGVYGEFVDLWLDGEKLTEGVDYKSESGSTRITIYTQTLSDGKDEGTHTLGIEFRTSDTDTLKRAAQNYVLDNSNSGGSNGGSDNGSNSGGSDGNNAGNGNSLGAGGTNDFGNSSPVNSASAMGSGEGVADIDKITYTVQKGDTLWKIALKLLGDGNQWGRIYEDNRDVINNPDRIYPGQVLKIRVGAVGNEQDEASDVVAGDTYIVQPGDSLWKIALKVYGNGRRWRKIYEANSDKISDASKIYVGQVILIPE